MRHSKKFIVPGSYSGLMVRDSWEAILECSEADDQLEYKVRGHC